MRRSPYNVAQELKETLATYLETAYRISHQDISDERSHLLRQQMVVNQTPFVETTPRFASGKWLHELNDLPHIPPELYDFARIGLPVGSYPLYAHQEEAVRAAWNIHENRPGNVIVASGTGSGKTETFYLTILADILREARDWKPPQDSATDMGRWTRSGWLHRRHNEQRQAAIRAIILYPMNALVNDQLRRLRRTLATNEAIQWQRENMQDNLIYFGRYTSQTMLPGTPKDRKKRNRWRDYIGGVRSSWMSLSENLRDYSPRPDGPEMLCRWNMQNAPPDILLTSFHCDLNRGALLLPGQLVL